MQQHPDIGSVRSTTSTGGTADADIKPLPLVGAQGYQRFPLSQAGHWAGQDIALHAAPADRTKLIKLSAVCIISVLSMHTTQVQSYKANRIMMKKTQLYVWSFSLTPISACIESDGHDLGKLVTFFLPKVDRIIITFILLHYDVTLFSVCMQHSPQFELDMRRSFMRKHN